MIKGKTSAGAKGSSGAGAAVRGKKQTSTGAGGKKQPSAREEIAVTRHYCGLPRVPERKLAPGMNPDRVRLILQTSNKWLNGTTLRYWFFDKPAKWTAPDAEKAVVRRAFQMWKDLGIGLNFVEVKDPATAQVRIAFDQSDGSWSYLGNDVLRERSDPRTMNFGWSLTADPEEGLDTALHEIGHTLGFPHEHQNPFAGIVWNEEAVYRALAAEPNRWNRQKTFYNIIRKITPDEVQGSSWDPDSVMHYPFEAGLIDKPVRFRSGLRPAGGLSQRDRDWVRQFYPPIDDASHPLLVPLQSVPLTLAAGQQANFRVEPTDNREYEFRTFGEADTVMALFQQASGKLTQVAEDDDSGTDRNAAFRLALKKNAKYVLRVRLYCAATPGRTAVMCW